MAGDIFLKDRAIISLTTSGASLTNGSAGVANALADLDCRAVAAVGNATGDMRAIFQLTCQWVSTAGIVGGTIIADMCLVPLVDGATLPQITLTAGSSYLPFNYRVGTFVASAAPAATTDTTFATMAVDLMPVLYRPYILNRSGVTITANWTLKVVTARQQYT